MFFSSFSNAEVVDHINKGAPSFAQSLLIRYPLLHYDLCQFLWLPMSLLRLMQILCWRRYMWRKGMNPGWEREIGYGICDYCWHPFALKLPHSLSHSPPTNCPWPIPTTSLPALLQLGWIIGIHQKLLAASAGSSFSLGNGTSLMAVLYYLKQQTEKLTIVNSR